MLKSVLSETPASPRINQRYAFRSQHHPISQHLIQICRLRITRQSLPLGIDDQQRLTVLVNRQVWANGDVGMVARRLIDGMCPLNGNRMLPALGEGFDDTARDVLLKHTLHVEQKARCRYRPSGIAESQAIRQ